MKPGNDARRTTGAQLLVLLLVAAMCAGVLRYAGLRFYHAAYPVHYTQDVLLQSEAHDVPPELVFAVIRTESGFNPDAHSSAQARGLMQITKDTFEWAQFRIQETEPLHFDDLFRSDLNIRYGTAILRLLLEEFGTEENALCAYHAGWGNAKKWLADPKTSSDGVHIDTIPFGDTRRYVEKVMETKRIYSKLYTFK